MARFPEYQQTTTAQAPNTGIFIPAPNSAVLSKISEATYKLAEDNVSEITRDLGRRDAERSDGIVDIGPVGRLFSTGRAYQEGANQVTAVRKKAELEGIVSDLQKDPALANDPEAFRKAYVTKREGWMKDVPMFLAPAFASVADNTQLAAIKQINDRQILIARDQRAADTVKTLDKLRSDTYDGIRNGSMNADDIDAKQAEMNALIQGAIKQGDIAPMQAKRLLDEAGFNVRKAETMVAFDKNPTEAFVNAIKSGKEVFEAKGPQLTPEQREHLGATVEREFHMRQAKANAATAAANAALAKQKNDDLVMRETTGEGVLTPVQVDAMFAKNPVAALEFKNLQKLSTDTYHFRNSVALTSQAEDVQKLSAFMPQPGAVGYADSMKVYEHNRKVIDQKWSAIYGDGQRPGDPAQYIMTRSPEIAAGITSPDPEVRSIAIATMGQLQTQMGIPPGRQSVIPNVTAQNLARDLQVVSGEEAAKMIGGLSNQYGPAMPSVLRQLADLKIPKEYQVLAMMQAEADKDARVELANALKTPMKDLTENLDKRLPGVKTDMDREIQRSLTDFSRTVQAQGSLELLDSVNDAVSRLAYYKASMGMNKTEAVKYATNAITGRWDYLGDLRVPKGTTRAVEAAGEHLKSTLTAEMLVPLRSDSIYTDEQRRAAQLQQAKNGRLVMNPEGDGAILVYPNGHPVLQVGQAKAPVAAPASTATVPTDVQTRALTNRQPVTTTPNAANTEKINQAQAALPRRPNYIEFKFKDAPDLAKKLVPQYEPVGIVSP